MKMKNEIMSILLSKDMKSQMISYSDDVMQQNDLTGEAFVEALVNRSFLGSSENEFHAGNKSGELVDMELEAVKNQLHKLQKRFDKNQKKDNSDDIEELLGYLLVLLGIDVYPKDSMKQMCKKAATKVKENKKKHKN